jgi:hypothetical protein
MTRLHFDEARDFILRAPLPPRAATRNRVSAKIQETRFR